MDNFEPKNLNYLNWNLLNYVVLIFCFSNFCNFLTPNGNNFRRLFLCSSSILDESVEHASSNWASKCVFADPDACPLPDVFAVVDETIDAEDSRDTMSELWERTMWLPNVILFFLSEK